MCISNSRTYRMLADMTYGNSREWINWVQCIFSDEVFNWFNMEKWYHCNNPIIPTTVRLPLGSVVCPGSVGIIIKTVNMTIYILI